jgi:hypothetical protein
MAGFKMEELQARRVETLPYRPVTSIGMVRDFSALGGGDEVPAATAAKFEASAAA